MRNYIPCSAAVIIIGAVAAYVAISGGCGGAGAAVAAASTTGLAPVVDKTTSTIAGDGAGTTTKDDGSKINVDQK